MGIYDIEKHKIEQEELWSEIRRYVEGVALDEELHKVEFSLFRQLLILGLSLLKEVVARHGSGKTSSVIDRDDGNSYRHHGQRSRKYLSIFGQLSIERAYYWSSEGKGYCPLDDILNLPQRLYSYLLQQWIQSEIAETTYDHAIEMIGNILGIDFWKRGHENVTLECTCEVETFYFQKPSAPAETEGSVICVTADCKGVRMVPGEKPEIAKTSDKQVSARRSKGEKRTGLRRDAVVTSDFTFHPEARDPEELVDALMKTGSEKDRQELRLSLKQRRDQGLPLPREPLNKQTFATMDGKTVAFADLFDRVGYRDPTLTKPIYVLIDGEPALEHRVCEEISLRGWDHRVTGVCLDIFHVMEYIWEAGTALYGEKGRNRTPWVRKTTTKILDGKVGYVIGALKQCAEKGRLRESRKQTLKKVIRYFENHRHMMTYDRFLAEGYPIATGVIEGACGSLVKNRTDCSGMRWTKTGVQAVLNLRSLKRNGDWEDYWEYYIGQEKQRRYRKTG